MLEYDSLENTLVCSFPSFFTAHQYCARLYLPPPLPLVKARVIRASEFLPTESHATSPPLFAPHFADCCRGITRCREDGSGEDVRDEMTREEPSEKD